MPIRRADRLFDILRILRSAKAPVTAASIADELEVTVRTVYRNSRHMQCSKRAALFDHVLGELLQIWGTSQDQVAWRCQSREHPALSLMASLSAQ